jgi:hypothetical protein
MAEAIGSYATSVGHPGIFMGQTRMQGIRNHVDIPYVTSLAPKDSLDFGVLDIYALTQRGDSPLLTMSVENAQIIYSNADYYTFELPSAADATTRIVSGGVDRAKFGMDGEEFPIVVTRRDFGPGSVITFDLTSKISFTVVDRPIEQLGEHFKLWVQLNTNDEVKYITRGEFIEGRQLIKLADIRGLDFSSWKSAWSISGMPSLAKYKNYLTNVTLQQSYEFTTGAVQYLNSATRFDARQVAALRDVALQFYMVNGIADNKVIDMRNPATAQQYKPLMQEAQAKGMGAKTMISFFDSLCVQMMLNQNNTQMVWGPGINYIKDGYDTKRMAPGMWFQLDRAGYKHGYSIETFNLMTLVDAIKGYEWGKTETKDRIETQTYKIRTGRGGQQLIHDAMIANGFSIPAVIQNADHNFITGQAGNLTYNVAQFTRYQIPYLGYIEVEYEPGFDPLKADEYVNPIIKSGHRLSSYTMIIEDYNTSRDNIAVVRRENYKVKMTVEAGEETHPYFQGNTNIGGQNVQIHQASDELTGFRVKMSAPADTAIVKDPTRLLKLVMQNPLNKRFAL